MCDFRSVNWFCVRCHGYVPYTTGNQIYHSILVSIVASYILLNPSINPQKNCLAMKSTCHSDYLPLKTVVIKDAKNAFISDDHISNQWKSLKFTKKPSWSESLEEYDSFEKLLARAGAEVKRLPQDDTVTLDSIYCRDAAIATDFGMILCNMGKKERMSEPQLQKQFYEKNGISVLGQIEGPGTLEGGDVAWVDQKTIAVGHSYRSNDEGIRQLKSMVEPRGVTVVEVHLPHHEGPDGLLHLMSVFSPIDKKLAVVYSPLLPIAFRKELIRRDFAFVEVCDDEFETMGCNVLALAPRKCLMVHGSPITQKALVDAGCEVHTYKGEHISLVGGGGPTCLTRPLERCIH